jgi:hypothetical protein
VDFYGEHVGHEFGGQVGHEGGEDLLEGEDADGEHDDV